MEKSVAGAIRTTDRFCPETDLLLSAINSHLASQKILHPFHLHFLSSVLFFEIPKCCWSDWLPPWHPCYRSNPCPPRQISHLIRHLGSSCTQSWPAWHWEYAQPCPDWTQTQRGSHGQPGDTPGTLFILQSICWASHKKQELVESLWYYYMLPGSRWKLDGGYTEGLEDDIQGKVAGLGVD